MYMKTEMLLRVVRSMSAKLSICVKMYVWAKMSYAKRRFGQNVHVGQNVIVDLNIAHTKCRFGQNTHVVQNAVYRSMPNQKCKQ